MQFRESTFGTRFPGRILPAAKEGAEIPREVMTAMKRLNGCLTGLPVDGGVMHTGTQQGTGGGVEGDGWGWGRWAIGGKGTDTANPLSEKGVRRRGLRWRKVWRRVSGSPTSRAPHTITYNATVQSKCLPDVYVVSTSVYKASTISTRTGEGEGGKNYNFSLTALTPPPP